MSRLRRITTVAALCAAVGGSIATASPATAEPSPCAGGRVDGGVGSSTFDPTTGKATIQGTWFNCSGGASVDHVKIDVANATDGPCIAVPYISTKSSRFQRTRVILNPAYRGWIRC